MVWKLHKNKLEKMHTGEILKFRLNCRETLWSTSTLEESRKLEFKIWTQIQKNCAQFGTCLQLYTYLWM